MESGAGRPLRIVVEGNCHAEIIAAAVDGAIRDTGAHAFVFRVDTNNPIPPEPDGFTSAEAAFVAACDVLVTQIRERPAPSARPLVPAGTSVIRYPAFGANFLWPFATQAHPLNRPVAPHMRYGPYPAPFGNRLINALLREESDPDRVFDRFMAIDPAEKTDLDRLFELCRDRMQALDAAADIASWPFVEAHFQQRKLFMDSGHTTWQGLEPVCRAILAALPLGLDGAAIDRVCRRLAQARPGEGKEAPIHPRVARHFGLAWCRPAQRWQHDVAGWHDHDAFVRRYIACSFDEDLYRAHYLARRGDDRLAEAEAALRRGLARDGRNQEARFALARIRLRQDRPDDALTLAEQALADPDLASDDRKHATHAAILQALGRTRAALAALDRAIALWPDHPDYRRQRAEWCRAEGDFAGAAAALQAALALEPSADLQHRLGLDLIAAGRTEPGLAALEAALELAPQTRRYALDLARSLGAARLFGRARAVLARLEAGPAGG